MRIHRWYDRFFIGNEERRSEIGQRRLRNTMDEIFDEVKQRYPYIFDAAEPIRLITGISLFG